MPVIDDTNPDDTVVVPAPTDLDTVHAMNMHNLGNDEEIVEEDEEIVEEVEEIEEVEEDILPEDPYIPPAPQPVELDTDTTKKGDGKIAVKNSDGETFYFNNLDEVPDEFEPATYKEWGRAVADFSDKRIADKQADQERQVSERAAANQKELDDVTGGWDKDIAALTKSGDLPKDANKREDAVVEVYNYMSQKLSQGVVVDSFAEAHKALEYEKYKAEQKKQATVTKKKQGGAVMGGNGGAASNGYNKMPPLPAHTSLDDVRARYANLK